VDWLPWQDAALVAVTTAIVTLVSGDRGNKILHGITTWTRELTIMFALYALWQYAGAVSVASPGDAVSRGRDIIRVEDWFRLPSETSVQRMVLGDPTLVKGANYYYAGLHVAVLGVCLVWLFARHRDRYPAVRNVLALITGVSLLLQLIPVAPPRLVPGSGLVDTGHTIGPSVYPAHVAPGMDQLSAMPSLHVGWALLVAGAAIYSLRSPWRWLAALYPLATTWVVVVTGNHYWADGIVEVALCAVAVAAQWAWSNWSAERLAPVVPVAQVKPASSSAYATVASTNRSTATHSSLT
jgi:hypothetical protein